MLCGPSLSPQFGAVLATGPDVTRLTVATESWSVCLAVCRATGSTLPLFLRGGESAPAPADTFARSLRPVMILDDELSAFEPIVGDEELFDLFDDGLRQIR